MVIFTETLMSGTNLWAPARCSEFYVKRYLYNLTGSLSFDGEELSAYDAPSSSQFHLPGFSIRDERMELRTTCRGVPNEHLQLLLRSQKLPCARPPAVQNRLWANFHPHCGNSANTLSGDIFPSPN